MLKRIISSTLIAAAFTPLYATYQQEYNNYQVENHSSVSDDLYAMNWNNEASEDDYFLTITRDDNFAYFYFKFPTDGINYEVSSINLSIKDELDEELFTYNDEFIPYSLTLVSENENHYQKYISEDPELLETKRLVVTSFNIDLAFNDINISKVQNLHRDEYYFFENENDKNKITSSLIDDYIEVTGSSCKEQIVKAGNYDLLDVFNIVQDIDSVAVDMYYYFFNFNIDDIIDSISKIEVKYTSFDWSLSLGQNVNNVGHDPRYKSFETLQEELSDSALASFEKSDEKEQFVEVEKGDVYDVTHKNILLGQKTFHFDRLFEVSSQSDEWILENGADFKYGCMFAAYNRYSTYPPAAVTGVSETNSTFVSEARILKISFISEGVFYDNVAIYDDGAVTEPADPDDGDIRDDDDLVDDNVSFDEITPYQAFLNIVKDFLLSPAGITILVFVGLILLLLVITIINRFVGLWKK